MYIILYIFYSYVDCVFCICIDIGICILLMDFWIVVFFCVNMSCCWNCVLVELEREMLRLMLWVKVWMLYMERVWRVIIVF